jgi:hypothetical protein
LLPSLIGIVGSKDQEEDDDGDDKAAEEVPFLVALHLGADHFRDRDTLFRLRHQFVEERTDVEQFELRSRVEGWDLGAIDTINNSLELDEVTYVDNFKGFFGINRFFDNWVKEVLVGSEY